jgi:hypothetical protein
MHNGDCGDASGQTSQASRRLDRTTRRGLPHGLTKLASEPGIRSGRLRTRGGGRGGAAWGGGHAAADMLLLNLNNAINLTLYIIEVTSLYALSTHTVCYVFRVILTINSGCFLKRSQPVYLRK